MSTSTEPGVARDDSGPSDRGLPGLLYGETAPERPLLTVKDPISITDLHATIFAAMGISPRVAFDVEKRWSPHAPRAD